MEFVKEKNNKLKQPKLRGSLRNREVLAVGEVGLRKIEISVFSIVPVVFILFQLN